MINLQKQKIVSLNVARIANDPGNAGTQFFIFCRQYERVWLSHMGGVTFFKVGGHKSKNKL